VSALLDVNMLLACGWQSHARHSDARTWLASQPEFVTCPLVTLGFLRVSMGPGFRASFADTLAALRGITSRPAAKTVPVDFDPANLPPLLSHAEVTDAYLVQLALAHGLRLATLDDMLCLKSWAMTVAFNPLASITPQSPP
jgi:predicted nucleic acid-binding protein